MKSTLSGRAGRHMFFSQFSRSPAFPALSIPLVADHGSLDRPCFAGSTMVDPAKHPPNPCPPRVPPVLDQWSAFSPNYEGPATKIMKKSIIFYEKSMKNLVRRIKVPYFLRRNAFTKIPPAPCLRNYSAKTQKSTVFGAAAL